MHPVRFPVAALALAGVACLPPRAAGADPDPARGSAVTVAGPSSPRVELLLERRVRAGEEVRVRLRAENVTRRRLDLYLRGRTTTVDVVIARADGGVVWRRLEGEIIPAIVHVRSLAPGERLEVEAAWDQRANDGSPVAPGEYVVEGALLVEGEPLRAPATPLTIVSADP